MKTLVSRLARRRSMLWVATLALTPALSSAQGPGQLPRVGILAPGPRPASEEPGSAFDRFVRALAGLGLVDGRTVQLVWRFDDRQMARMQQQAEELVGLRMDVIVAGTTGSALAAKRMTSSIPIVMAVSADPVADGLVASLGRPGGNVTGMSIMSPELVGRRLQLLAEVVPRLNRVALLLDQTTGARARAELQDYQAAAKRLNLQVLPIEIAAPDDFAKAFVEAKRQRADALAFMQSPLVAQHGSRLAELALTHRLPTISGSGEFSFARDGGLMTFGPNIGASWERAARFVERILKGDKPADMPVEQPTRFEFGINRQTAERLGLRIPESVLLLADQVFP